MKEFRTLLSPFIARLFNESLTTGYFTERYKHAIITPLFKSNMDVSQIKSDRPVCNLPFLSKLLERAVHFQLQAFLDANSALPAYQLAYRKNHSTETEIINVCDDLLKVRDNGQMSALCLLDLTAAFDTVDHELQLAWLVLAWFKSYLTGRTYCVIYAGASSSIKQGSVLGPLLFLLYTTDFAE